MKRKKIALFHPWIKSRGGSEKSVLEILKSRKYDIDIYTWIYEESKTFEEFKKFKINILAPKIIKKISRTYLLKGLFLPISLFSKIPLEKYEYFLISTSGVAEFITFRNYKPKKTYGYIYTPLRAAISFNKTGNTFIGCVDEQDNFKIDKGFSYSEDEVSFLITILTLLSKQKVWDMKFFN